MLELVSADLEAEARSPTRESPWEVDDRRQAIVARLAETPNLLAPMLRLPEKTQVGGAHRGGG